MDGHLNINYCPNSTKEQYGRDDDNYKNILLSSLFPSSILGFPGGSDSKESACSAGDLGWEDALEEGTATHSSILAWRIPWTGKLSRLYSMGSQ